MDSIYIYIKPRNGLYTNLRIWNPCAAEARKLEYDYPPSPKFGEEGRPACIVPGPHSNFLESTLWLHEGTDRISTRLGDN